MTAQGNVTAILATLNAALPVEAYDLGDVPSKRPSEYVEIVLSRRFGGETRVCQRKGLTGYRLTVRAISRQSAENVRLSLETCRAALEFKRITVGAVTSTPVQFETERPVASDESWFAGVLQFTYVIKE